MRRVTARVAGVWMASPEALDAARREADWLREEVSNTDHAPGTRVRFAEIATVIYALLSSCGAREAAPADKMRAIVGDPTKSSGGAACICWLDRRNPNCHAHELPESFHVAC